MNNVKRSLLFTRRQFTVARAVLRTIRESLMALYNSAEVLPASNDVDDTSIPSRRRSGSRTSSSSNNNDAKRSKPEQRYVFNDKELLKDNLSSTIPAALDLAWAINYVDITNTLQGACGKLFRDADNSASWEDRLRRAEAVHILGAQFSLVGLEATVGRGGNATTMSGGDAEEIKARASAAFMESLKKGRDNEEM